MSVLVLASLAVLAAATIGSIAVVLRTGETRVALLTGLLLLLGVQQSVALSESFDASLGFDLATASALAGLGIGVLGLLAVVAVGRTLRELDRAESIHWESMEGVRGLTDLASRRDVAIEERLPVLLEMGCERLGLEIGLVSRVCAGRYEVLAIHAPPDFPIAAGTAFDVDDTFCRATLDSDRPVAIGRAADAHWLPHRARNPFPFEAYLATRIHVLGEPRGTLVFASLAPRSDRFTASHKDLLVLMGQWIGAEIERSEIEKASREAPPEPTARASLAGAVERARRRIAFPTSRSLDLNTSITRLEKRLRKLLPANVELEVETASDLAEARRQRLPLDAIVLSLVRKAAEALPEGGRVTVATANHETPRGDPGVMNAVAPARYVTLSVAESSGAVDADSFNRVFETSDGEAPASPDADGGLPLSTVYRLLQRSGGDLSVEVEPGRGSRFVVFLPLAEEETPQPPAPRPSAAAAADAPRH